MGITQLGESWRVRADSFPGDSTPSLDSKKQNFLRSPMKNENVDSAMICAIGNQAREMVRSHQDF